MKICCVLLYFSICIYGYSLLKNHKIKYRVAGGSHAYPGEFPYVALSIHTDIKCTAVIIDRRFALGAAHCYWVNKAPVNPDDVTIIVGLTNVNEFNNTNIQRQTAKQIMINPLFKEKKLGKNDLALVEFQSPLTFDKFTSSIDLDTNPFPVQKQMRCMAIGWGDVEKNVEATNLVKLHVKAEHSDEACHGLSKKQYSLLLCVVEPESGRGLCDGDSGGPLICNDHLVGIAHQVYKELQEDDTEIDLACGMKGLVHTFIFVCKSLSWIQTHVKNTPEQPPNCFSEPLDSELEL